MAWTDRRIIEALDMADVRGLTASEIAAELGGVSRAAVLGILKRVRDELAASEAAPFPPGQRPARKPKNQDGGMPAGFWRKRKAWA